MNIEIMNYFKQDFVNFTWFTKTLATDNTGTQTATLTEAGVGEGDMQPVTENIIRAEAGQDTRTTNILFTDADLAIKAGDVLEINGKQYNVKEVLDYKTHKEIRIYALE